MKSNLIADLIDALLNGDEKKVTELSQNLQLWEITRIKKQVESAREQVEEEIKSRRQEGEILLREIIQPLRELNARIFDLTNFLTKRLDEESKERTGQIEEILEKLNALEMKYFSGFEKLIKNLSDLVDILIKSQKKLSDQIIRKEEGNSEIFKLIAKRLNEIFQMPKEKTSEIPLNREEKQLDKTNIETPAKRPLLKDNPAFQTFFQNLYPGTNSYKLARFFAEYPPGSYFSIKELFDRLKEKGLEKHDSIYYALENLKDRIKKDKLPLKIVKISCEEGGAKMKFAIIINPDNSPSLPESPIV